MSFDPYFDENGLICNAWQGPRFDGGDTGQKTGLLRFGRYLKFIKNKDQLGREQAKYAQELDMLEDPERPGWYRRHPDPTKFWSNSRNFSRDQHRSIVIAMGALKQQKRLLRTLWEHIKRFGFYQNDLKHDGTKKLVGDICSPAEWGEWLRALVHSGLWGFRVLYPLLLISDLWAILGILVSMINWKNPDDADDDNLIMSTLQAKLVMPTPLSWIARKLYVKIRPVAGFTDETKKIPLRGTMNITGPQSAIRHKHRLATGAPPFYEELYKDIMDKHGL